VGQRRRREFATDIPSAITMHDRVETRLGTLQFTDGFPDGAMVERVFDNLDFQHAVQAFLTSMPAASLAAMRKGLRDFGPDISRHSPADRSEAPKGNVDCLMPDPTIQSPGWLLQTSAS